MKTTTIALALSVLAGCSGISEAMNYSGTKPFDYQHKGATWRIYDQPENSRLMITPSLAKSGELGVTRVTTLGNSTAPYATAEPYRPAATAYLASKGCTITEGNLVITPQYEFSYAC